ncbi:Leucine-rich repeat domain, L domain-like [Phytophthora cactorum]|nr:Leucine-rich repeat domain, L domain-like [Phytophthora cactorum]
MPSEAQTDPVYSEVTTPKGDDGVPLYDEAAERNIKPNWILYSSILVALLQPSRAVGRRPKPICPSTATQTSAMHVRWHRTCLMFSGHSKLEWTFAVNAWIFGGMIGSLFCGHFSDLWGRKKLLFVNCFFMIAGAAIQTPVSNVWAFAFGRMVAGIASGTATGTLGAYTNELSHRICQLSGINAVFYYSNSIFEDAGISDPRVGTLIIDFVNIWPAFSTGFLAKRFGNRNLILWGIAGMFFMAVLMTVAFLVDVAALSVVFMAFYVIAFGATLGPLVWVITADLFPDSVRATATSIGIGVNWLCNLIVGVSYPYIADAFDDYSYVPFVVLLAIFYVLSLKLVPETSSLRGEAPPAPSSPDLLINLSRNNLGDETAEAICDALHNDKWLLGKSAWNNLIEHSLTIGCLGLNLGGNHLSQQGTELFIDTLSKRNQTLAVLALANMKNPAFIVCYQSGKKYTRHTGDPTAWTNRYLQQVATESRDKRMALGGLLLEWGLDKEAVVEICYLETLGKDATAKRISTTRVASKKVALLSPKDRTDRIHPRTTAGSNNDTHGSHQDNNSINDNSEEEDGDENNDEVASSIAGSHVKTVRVNRESADQANTNRCLLHDRSSILSND